MKKVVSLALVFAAVAILGTALRAATEKASTSTSVSAKSAKPCCQDKSIEPNAVANESPKSACCSKGQLAVSTIAKAEPCSGDSCKAGKKDADNCKLCATAATTSDVKSLTNIKIDTKACADGQCPSTEQKASCCKASAESQVVANPSCMNDQKQCLVGNAGECKGECGKDAAAKLTSTTASGGLNCKDCPEKDCKGDCGTCEAAKATVTETSAGQKCGMCSEKDCKEECSGCAEARKETETAKSDQTALVGKHGGMGRGRGHGHAGDSQHDKDHQDFFYLIEHRDSIRRTVKNIPKGVETLTESDDDDVATMIQTHVEAMYDRMEHVNPIRMRDPLFREVFVNAKKIKMKVEHTDQGVRVTETSDDAYAVKLIQAHAKVVSLWIKNGYSELPKNHAAPQQ